MTDQLTIEDWRRATIPKQRAMGFFVFATCAVVAVLFTAEQHTESSHPKAGAASSTTSPDDEVQVRRAQAGIMPRDAGGMQKAARPQQRQDTKIKRESVRVSLALDVVAFDSPSFPTGEKARFSDDQRQLAIDAPLRTDLLNKEDGAFKVCFRSRWQARSVECPAPTPLFSPTIMSANNEAWARDTRAEGFR
jgi:hypothetical protein